MPTCYTCGSSKFEDWKALAEHVVEEHPNSKGYAWAEEFLSKNPLGGKRRREQRERQEREERQRREQEADEARRRAQDARARWRSSGDNFWEDFHRTFSKLQDNRPLQQQAIDILQKLFEYNMSDGEIQTIVALAKKRAKK